MVQTNFKKFEKSSFIYDSMYHDKNYKKESAYLKALLKYKKVNKILDLGCGTCSHLIALTKFCKHSIGIDANKQMVKIANIKIKKNKIKNIKVINKNILDFNSKSKFDVIFSLFHVVNYLAGKDEISKFFYLVSKTLNKNGILIFDFWNKHLKINESNKTTKIVKNKSLIIERKSISTYSSKTNITNVNFKYLVKKINTNEEYQFNEKHIMKSFDRMKLKKIAAKFGLSYVACYKWLSRKNLELKDKTGVIIFKN